ncbi:hypothetical protein ACWF2L_37515 [Streptomyces anulatus]
MISLHEVHKYGSDAVKAAVLAFGARHRPDGAEPDWKRAEKHFTYLIEIIMGEAGPLEAGAGAVLQAENAAIDFLLAVNNRSDYRCPICIKRQCSPR